MTDLDRLLSDSATLQLRKVAIPVAVAFATADGVCETLEGPVSYRAGDALLTGPRGERWPVERDRFLASYIAVTPEVSGAEGPYVKRPTTTLARRLDRPLAVPVGWCDDPLYASPGDWLLRYADGSYGVVQDQILRETYEPDDDESRWPPV